MRINCVVVGIFIMLHSQLLQATPNWRGPDDPLLGYILTNDFDKALKEINLRLEATSGDKIQKNELLLQKISIYLNKHEPKDALKSLEEISSDYFQNNEFQYKSWLVYWEMLKQTPNNDPHFKNYLQKARSGLSFTLNDASLFNSSLVDKATEYLKAYPDIKLSTEISDHLTIESEQQTRGDSH